MQKKKIVIASIVAVAIISVVLVVPLFNMVFQRPIIGTIKGPEQNLIEIDGIRYVKNSDHKFSGADRGEYLGAVTDGNITMRVYAVKGGKYIYTLWDWDGAFYVQED